MQEVNFADLVRAAGDAGFTVLPKAWYDVVVDAAEPGEIAGGDNAGCPRIKVKFRVISGPYAAQNAKVTNNFNLIASNPTQLGFFFQHMEALGLPKEWFASLPPQQAMQIAAQALLGRQGRILVDDERVYNGRKQNDVKDIQPPSGVAMPAALPSAPMMPQAGVPQFGQPQFPTSPQAAPFQAPAAFPSAPPAIPTPGFEQQAPAFAPPAPAPQYAPPAPPGYGAPASPFQPPAYAPPGAPSQPQQEAAVNPGAPQFPPQQQTQFPPQQPQQAPPPPPGQLPFGQPQQFQQGPPAYQQPPAQPQPVAPPAQQAPPPPPQQGGLPF